MAVLLNFWLSFLAGLFAPLGAVCVLPLYPGFLSYLAAKTSDPETGEKKSVIIFGWLVTLGIIISLFVFGLIFSKILESSLTNAIAIISPIAFGILGIISILLIFNVDFGKIFPKTRNPVMKNPYWGSLVFGLFFGAIVLPCNPASLIVLFAITANTTNRYTLLFSIIYRRIDQIYMRILTKEVPFPPQIIGSCLG